MTMQAGATGNASAAAELRLAAYEPRNEGSDRRDFEQCAKDLRPDLYRYAVWISGDRSVAEDAVQEALIRAWRSWDSLKADGAVKSWLRTIVRRECARLFERKRLPTRNIDELTDAESNLMVTAEDTAAAAELRRAISALEETYREPLVLQLLMGYSAAEIAGIMGIKPGAVLTRLHRARQKLIPSPGGPDSR